MTDFVEGEAFETAAATSDWSSEYLFMVDALGARNRPSFTQPFEAWLLTALFLVEKAATFLPPTSSSHDIDNWAIAILKFIL